jgi:hypothetical protein
LTDRNHLVQLSNTFASPSCVPELNPSDLINRTGSVIRYGTPGESGNGRVYSRLFFHRQFACSRETKIVVHDVLAPWKVFEAQEIPHEFVNWRSCKSKLKNDKYSADSYSRSDNLG